MPRTERKKIDLVAVSAFPPDRGRLSEYSYSLMQALSRKGLRIKVGSDSPANWVGNIEVAELWKPENIPSMFRILRFVVKSRARHVVFNTHFLVFGKSRLVNFLGFVNIFLASQLGRLMRFRTTAIVHNLPEASSIERFGLKPTFVNRVGFLLAERLLFGCQTVVVTLKLYKRILEGRFHRPVFYLPHGTWKAGGPSAEPRSSRILFFGFLSPGKDMVMLRGVFDELRERHRDMGLRIVASPHPNLPESRAVLDWFKGTPGIEVRGYVPEEELPGAFEDCQAVVLPYFTSLGTSGVLHLANSFGVPVVATDLPEFREMKAEGAGVILCANKEEMVASLERLMTDREFRRENSARAREYASRLEWDTVAGQLLQHMSDRAAASQV